MYNKDKTVIHLFPAGKTGNFTIPNHVTKIGDGAFYGCNGLTSVTIPNSISIIGTSAFQCCGLTSITIPNSISVIGTRAFRECNSLISVVIPNSVLELGISAFSWCSGLTSVTLPNSKSKIESGLFSGCINLTSVTIPDSVTEIGDYAFERCGLTSITIPSKVSKIGPYAFIDCNSLTAVYYVVDEPIDCPNIFDPKAYDNATLYTTEIGEVIGRNRDPWKNFKHIVIVNDLSSIVLVNELSFKQSSYAVTIDETLDLKEEVVIMPENATNKKLTWQSSDESVATVSADGVVTILAEGSCSIVATTTDGTNISAKCTIDSSAAIAGISLNDEYDVYSTSGLLIMRGTSISEIGALAKGIYIVRQGRSVRKVAVK